jgi:hypothetical protein
MPKSGELDRCVEHIKKQYISEGKSEKESESIAWAVCKKQQKEIENKNSHKLKEW